MLSILSALCGSQIFYQKIQLTPRTLPVGVCLQGACVWQILNGLCLVLLLRKWTWHYSSITTAIPPLISPLFSSLPPLSLRLSPSPGLLSFSLPSACPSFFLAFSNLLLSSSFCLFDLNSLPDMPHSPSVSFFFSSWFYPTLLAYSTFHIFSFPFTVFSPRVYRSPLLSIFKSAPFHHYSLHHSSSLLIF